MRKHCEELWLRVSLWDPTIERVSGVCELYACCSGIMVSSISFFGDCLYSCIDNLSHSIANYCVRGAERHVKGNVSVNSDVELLQLMGGLLRGFIGKDIALFCR